ncbi:cupin domain-containing protein [Agarivorans sp. MS3-6]|uniref:cupin domain-containing protein n=1 Tax=Agarivorans sp. TSD2052 TaxID=2937286 RepID=UPI0020105E42|nr:cupin domain-containing protein [Agarivorans sp. TSD2052]UPW17011.1 cupin domain-containing protein [Agarivorans sp. TSD2052]
MLNLFANLPDDVSCEHFSDLLSGENVRVERIVSYGQRSPAQGWYDQAENEWVVVLEGNAILVFEDGTALHLAKGDYVTIPAHTKHKVAKTAQHGATIWLAIFYC